MNQEAKKRFRIQASYLRIFKRQLKKLEKKYRSVETDLSDALEKIDRHYSRYCHARSVLGMKNKVWEYRFRSTDQAKGSSGGFRLSCFLDDESSTLYPILIYAKSQRRKEPTYFEIKQMIRTISSE